jgi:hypothetical protein
MKSTFIERRVLVCFKKNISADLINQYFDGIEELRRSTPNLLTFELHKFSQVECEDVLSKTVANVTFPDVMTLWRFNDEDALELFLKSAVHHEIAQKKFRPAVEHRIVFNSRSDQTTSTFSTADSLRVSLLGGV